MRKAALRQVSKASVNSAQPRSSSRALAVVHLLYAGIGAAVMTASIHASWASDTKFLLASVVSCGCAALFAVRTGIWSARSAYSAVFCLFHFGLTAAVGVGALPGEELTGWDRAWLFGPYGDQAVVLASAGFCAFAFGAVSIESARRRHRPTPTPTSGLSPAFAALGATAVLGAICAWFAVAIAGGGAGILVGSYENYLTATSFAPGVISLVWTLLGLGIVLLVAGPATRLTKPAIALLACFGLVALPLGLRGELMFPAVAALVGAARAGRQMPAWRTWVVVGAVLLIIPAIREIRSFGVNELSDVAVRPKIVDALAEMGGSLHPVEKVIRWHDEGEDFIYGASYWAPFERPLMRILPGGSRVSAEEDERIMNVLVSRRVGYIGFSPVAEAYRNFGVAGVLVIMVLVGLIIGAIDLVRNSNFGIVLIATVLVPLLINVRNSFVSVPASIALGTGVVLAIRFAQHLHRHIGSPRATRPAAGSVHATPRSLRTAPPVTAIR